MNILDTFLHVIWTGIKTAGWLWLALICWLIHHGAEITASICQRIARIAETGRRNCYQNSRRLWNTPPPTGTTP